jgi:mono/diheme cytochrome c family protein
MKTKCILVSVLLLFATVNWVIAQGWPGDPKNGRAIYEKHCIRCHGVAGKGDGVDGASLVVPPANFQSQRSREKPDFELLITISHGIAYSPMHGWRGRLSEDEMWDVISYIRTMASFKPL